MNMMLQVAINQYFIRGFLLGMGIAFPARLDAAEVRGMSAELANLQKQTQAKPGDKTLMDAVVPAVEAMQLCKSEDIVEVMQAGADAALAGAAATTRMKANYGRARNYGERSVGFADSGATSWSCILQSFVEALKTMAD